MKIGYVRTSTAEQNTARQEVLMKELGVDQVYIDHMSGKSLDRPELKQMMEYDRKGDTVIVESISRFARNTRDLLELVERLTAKGVEFISKKEAIDTTTSPSSGPWLNWNGNTFCSASKRVSPSPKPTGCIKVGSPSSAQSFPRWWPCGGRGRLRQWRL